MLAEKALSSECKQILRLAQDAGVAERVAARLRPDAEPVRALPDRDLREQPPGRGRDRVHDGVVAAGEPEHAPSAETPPMSGLPPPGICQVATTFRVAKLITEIEPAVRLVTYRSLLLRLG